MFAGAVTDSLDWFVGLVTKALVMALMVTAFHIGGGLASGQVQVSDLSITGVKRVVVRAGELVSGASRRHVVERALDRTESPFEVAGYQGR